MSDDAAPKGEGHKRHERSRNSVLPPCLLILRVEPLPAARYPPRIASISTRATSGRLNWIGGTSPAASISRTFVPLSVTCSERSCGQVFAEAIASHVLQ